MEHKIIMLGPLFLMLLFLLPGVIAIIMFKKLKNNQFKFCFIIISFLLSWVGFVLSIIIMKLYNYKYSKKIELPQTGDKREGTVIEQQKINSGGRHSK